MQNLHILPRTAKPAGQLLYNLDVIIAVGCRIERQMRHPVPHPCHAGFEGAPGTGLNPDKGQAVQEVLGRYARAWQLLLQYDEERLSVPESRHGVRVSLKTEDVRQAIAALKKELMARGEATDFFGQERGHGLEGIIEGIDQTFGGQELYPDVESKAAHILYFVIKDHPFIDGNKRIASFLFVLYLQQNGLEGGKNFDDRALVALALLVAASEPGHKDLLVRLIMNLITEEK